MASRGVLPWIGGGLLLLLTIVGLAAPVLAPFDPRSPAGEPLMGGTPDHLLGTNDLGQDNLSRLLYGTRSTLFVAGAVTVLSACVSWSVGLIAGLFRRAEAPLLFLTDLVLVLPSLPLYLLSLTLVGPSTGNVVLLLALLSWPSFARVVHSVVRQTRALPYVDAARALGASERHILLRHLLPATLPVLPTKLVLTMRFAIFTEATLAFLGLASDERISWGMMLNWAFADPLLFARPVWPWLVLPPTVAIALLMLATTWSSELLAGGWFGDRSAEHRLMPRPARGVR